MSEKVYKGIFGRAAFDSESRDYNGGKVVSVSVNPFTAKDPNFKIRVTLWPELGIESVKQGDFVIVYGTYEQVSKDGNVYHNLSANSAVVLEPKRQPKREVVNQQNKPDASAGSEDDLF